MQTLWKLRHSIWLITFVMAFHLALPAFASALSSGPRLFTYDEQNQARVVYDVGFSSVLDYDSVIVSIADSGGHATLGAGSFFDKTAGFLAADSEVAQITLNRQAGISFQNQVSSTLGATPGGPMTGTTLSGASYTTIPDGILQNGSLLEVKNSQYVSFTPQLQAQVYPRSVQ